MYFSEIFFCKTYGTFLLLWHTVYVIFENLAYKSQHHRTCSVRLLSFGINCFSNCLTWLTLHLYKSRILKVFWWAFCCASLASLNVIYNAVELCVFFSYSVWKHIACNKLQISEDMAWTWVVQLVFCLYIRYHCWHCITYSSCLGLTSSQQYCLV